MNIHDSFVLFLARQPPVGPGLLIYEVSRSHTQWRTTVVRTLLDEWSARRRYLYLTIHTTLTTNVLSPSGIRTANLSRRTAADRVANGTGKHDSGVYR